MSHLRLVKFYHRHEDSLGRIWLVPYDTKFPADDIWLWSPERAGGETRVFTLGPGSSIETRGARLSNAEALYQNTGVDVRERHAIKLKVYRAGTDDLLYCDHDWIPNSVATSRHNAQHIANHNGVQVTAKIQTADDELVFILYPEPVEPLKPVA